MKKPLFCLYFCIVFIICTYKSFSFPADTMIKKLLEKSNQYQVTIFRRTINREDYAFLQKLSETLIPTIILDLSKLNLSTLAVTRRSTIYVIFYSSTQLGDNDFLYQVKQDLDTVTYVPISRTRPKCLLLLFRVTNIEVLRQVLNYAWSLKFLDFTIIHNSYIFHYNPFTSSYTVEALTSNSLLFPDKTQNMHGYELKMPFIDSSPYITRHNDTYEGSEYRILRAVARILNFRPVILDYGTEYQALKKAVKDLERGMLNALPFSLFTTHPLTLNKKDLVCGKVFLFDSFKGVVSSSLTLKQDPSLQLLKILTLLFAGMVLVLAGVYIVNRLKIAKKKFKIFDTVQLLLGEPGVRLPKAGADRIICVSIVLLSMTYFSDMFSEMTEYELMNTPIQLTSYKDLVDSKLTPYVNVGLYNWIFNSSDESLQALKVKAERKSANDCVRYILEGQRVICLMFKSKAIMYMLKNVNDDGSSKLRMAEVQFLGSGKNFVFEKASPYVEKIDKIMTGLTESGILFSYFKINKINKTKLNQQKEKQWLQANDSVLVNELCTILLIGYILSIIVFVIEISYRLLCMKFYKKFGSL